MTARTLLAACAILTAVSPGAHAQGAPPFRIVQIGDSFASGEGAPGVPGHHNEASGALLGDPDVWDAALQGSARPRGGVPPRAGTAGAARRLAAEFPRVAVQFHVVRVQRRADHGGPARGKRVQEL